MRTFPRWITLLPAWAILPGCAPLHLPDARVRHIAFGDSATAGWGGPAYCDMLRNLLGESNGAFANLGRSGESARQGVARLRAVLDHAAYPNAETLLYWQGGHDVTEFIARYEPLLLNSPDAPGYSHAADLVEFLDGVQADVESAICLGQDAGLRVFVATYYPLCKRVRDCPALPLGFVLPLQAECANAYIARLNERIRLAAANQGATLVDIGARAEVLRADPRNYADCNHLNARGNQIVAQVFSEAITRPQP